MRRTGRLFLAALVAVLTAAVGLTVAAVPASAAALTEVTGFGTNPTNLRMYLYVPNNVAARPGLLVASHFCQGSGPALFNSTDFDALADRYGFIVVYPSVTRSGGCWDVHSPQALRRDGGSDPVGIKSMIDYVRQRYPVDASRITAVGLSSGAMMTNVLLGLYPDVFAAGTSWSGVPFGCFATSDGNEWNNECANGRIIKTAQQWGDLVRNAYPGYTGRRPRVQIWHGTVDQTLHYPNFGEQIKLWTNVHGLSQTPDRTDSPKSGYTRTRYGGTGDTALVEATSLQGYGHSMPVDAAATIHFLGLDTTGTSTPAPTPTITTPAPTTPVPTTPAPTTPAPTGGCRVAYSADTWNTGLTASVTVTNTGGTAVNGWSLGFTLPAGQRVVSAWNATVAPVTGAVIARNVSYNAGIAPGASVSFGFQGEHTGNTARPAAFTLNGSPCTTA
jgi:poly(hydroxyalkanoate) depolymerase family esterase